MAKNLNQLYEIVVQTALTDKRHQDYDRVTSLARDYRIYATGENAKSKLRQFNARESDAKFAQRQALTTIVTPCIVSRLTHPERKIAGVKPTVKRYSYEKNKDHEQYKKLDSIVKGFYGGDGVDMFLKDVWMDMYDTDPNGFMLYLYSDFDGSLPDKIVYASAITSQQAIDYEYIEKILQYLTVHTKIKYERKSTNADQKKPELKDGKYYSIFGDNDQIELSEIDPENISGIMYRNELVEVSGSTYVKVTERGVLPEAWTPKEAAQYYLLTEDSKLYEVTFASHKSGRVPAFRVGNISDPVTYGRTVVNLWHKAVPYLEKSIKSISELDISESLHVFPQEFIYQQRCQGQLAGGIRLGCNQGQTPDGKECLECGGTGLMRHKSGQDTITLGMPRTPEEMFDLKNMKVYADLPMEIVEWLENHIDKIENKAIRTVYNSDLYTRDVVVQGKETATGKNMDMQAYYDSLSPVSQRYSYAWRFTVRQSAIYHNLNAGLVVEHMHPHNFRYESEADLIARISAAKQAEVSPHVLTQLNDDLTALVYTDQPDILKEIRVKRKFNPFEGRSEGMVMSLIAQGMVSEYDKVLFANFRSIFNKLVEQELKKDTEDGFYDLPYTKQKELVDAEVQALMLELKQQQVEQAGFQDGDE